MSRNLENMSTYRDVEKGVLDEEDRALLGARNEGRQDDEEHPNRADDMELADYKEPDPSSINIANDNVNAEERNELEESNVSEGTNDSEESKNKLQKLWDQNTSLLDAIATHNNTGVMSLLKSGANPNATCPLTLTSACHVAAFSNEEALQILLDAGAERKRCDCMGNTPLHYAAWTNAPKKIAMILNFPEGLTNEVTKVNRPLTPEQETKIQEIGARLKSIVDGTGTMVFPSVFDSAVPDEWMTNDDVRDFGYYPRLGEPGCSALHAASEAAHPQCLRLLLAAGADPNLRDESNSTPLDVAGASSSNDYVQSYAETLQLLRNYGGNLSRVESLVLERALRKRSLQALTLLLDAGAPINHRNPSGYTPMHVCVELRLKEHLEVLANHSSPEMNYRAVDVTDEEGSTVLHWAAREHWSDGVTVALLARANITDKNSVGDTALHLAAKAGDFTIVKLILDHDTNRECDFSKENYKGESPFSNAIFSGNADIVKLMLELNNEMRDYLHRNVGDLTPLEYAAEKKFQKLFILILNEQNEYLDKNETFRIVNVIAKYNLWELFTELEHNNFILYPMKGIVSKNYTLHEANKHSSRETIIVLLENGADLSQKNEDGQTAISLLMYHVTKPTEFMTKILDECIKTDKNIYDRDCVITINYSVLMPVSEYEENDSDPLNTKAKDMKVLEALIETGDVYDQRSLLTHPVIESFLLLKWKTCAKYIYFLICAYVLFLISLNTFIVTIFYHMDHKRKAQNIFFVFQYPIFWRFFALFSLCLFSLVDHLFWTSFIKKWYRNKTIWIKSFLTVGGVLMISIPMDAADNDIVRGVAVITVSLSWIYLMIYLSWTPTLGYYMQMYGKVSENVIKVMLSFSFPLVGFSICFMILLHSREPFDDPIAAFLKTMVMMSSEFEYENLVKNTTSDSPTDAKNSTLDSLEDEPTRIITSLFMLRIFFLLFFVSVAIVLINLMLGVAVSDYQVLSHDGKQRRLMKQIECISVLEKVFQRKPFSTFKFTEMKTMKVPSKVEVKPDSTFFGREMKEIILNKAQSLIETEEEKAGDVSMKEKIDDMYDLTKKLFDLVNEVAEMRKSINTNCGTCCIQR